MAAIKNWTVHNNVFRSIDYCLNPDKIKLINLEQALLYATDQNKTMSEAEEAYIVTRINCNSETVAGEMIAVQKRFGKTGGIIKTDNRHHSKAAV